MVVALYLGMGETVVAAAQERQVAIGWPVAHRQPLVIPSRYLWTKNERVEAVH
jgi:hypothetical protein